MFVGVGVAFVVAGVVVAGVVVAIAFFLADACWC